MLYKNELAILEYDDSQKAVIMPNHEKLGPLPKKAVFAFLNEKLYEFIEANNGKQISVFETMSKDVPIYEIEYKGEKICICQALVGSASSTCMLDFLYGYGVEEVISVGSCGTLIDLPENELLVPKKALRDEGTSFHYLPASRSVELDAEMAEKIGKTLEQLDYKYEYVNTWTTDALYRETKDLVQYRIEEGYQVVEMECSALASCAKFRNKKFGQILFTADSLADLDNHDLRDLGENSHEIVIYLALEVLINRVKVYE